MKTYKHLFFDLDRTLWDFEANANLTLRDIYEHFSLEETIPYLEEFVDDYHLFNDRVWEYFKKGRITKAQLRIKRFQLILDHYGIEDKTLANKMSGFYLDKIPNQQGLINGAREVLGYLYPNYRMYIVSNGFHEIQTLKLSNTGLIDFFTKIFTSDRTGYAKPDKRFFEYVVKSVHARKAESLVIGDDLNDDILGARNAGIDQVFLNRNSITVSPEPSFTISKLAELTMFL